MVMVYSYHRKLNASHRQNNEGKWPQTSEYPLCGFTKFNSTFSMGNNSVTNSKDTKDDSVSISACPDPNCFI